MSLNPIGSIEGFPGFGQPVPIYALHFGGSPSGNTGVVTLALGERSGATSPLRTAVSRPVTLPRLRLVVRGHAYHLRNARVQSTRYSDAVRVSFEMSPELDPLITRELVAEIAAVQELLAPPDVLPSASESDRNIRPGRGNASPSGAQGPFRSGGGSAR